MLLTVTATEAPARDLGLLARKHPDRVQTFELGFGKVHIFYPIANDERCTLALLLDIDPVALVRGRAGAIGTSGLLDAYVNDRPYVASSFMSVAISRVLGTALSGSGTPSVDSELPRRLSATIEPIRVSQNHLAARLFEPLGYSVEAEPLHSESGDPRFAYQHLTIGASTTLKNLLTHLYVLIPVLDNAKHYWVSDDELDKLFRFGGQWLAKHPERELISRRYLRRAPGLARVAIEKLTSLDNQAPEQDERSADATERDVEKPLRLQERRIAAVIAALRDAEARSVIDIGCGEGDLLSALMRESQFSRVGATDVSTRELERAQLRLDRQPMAVSRREDLTLFHSSLVYVDARLRGYDAAALLEVIEHIDEDRLGSVEHALFADARPRTIIMTTPNREYNVRFPNIKHDGFRHTDHRFEWSRGEFRAWCTRVSERHGYTFELAAIGDVHETIGPPTQMAVFRCS